MTTGIGTEDRLGRDQLTDREFWRQRAARTGRDHHAGRRPCVLPLGERAGAEPDSRDLEASAGIARPGTSVDGIETEMASEPPRLDVERGENENAAHTSGADRAARAASRLRSQAAYELPAAVSRPVKRTVRISA